MIRGRRSLALRILALIFGSTIAAAACPDLTVTLKTNVESKSTYAGKTVTLIARITNTGKTTLTGVGAGFYVANGLCRLKASLSPNPKPKAVFLTDGGNNVYWESFTLAPRKRRTIKMKTRVAGNLTVGAMLPVAATAYVAGDNCSIVAGPQMVKVAARPASKKALHPPKKVACGTNPIPDSTLPLALAAVNQRCNEAQLVQVGNGRRLGGAPLITAETCWEACSLQGFTTSFFVNLYESSAGNQCFCCQTCHLIHDPDFTVYQANAFAPLACGNGVCTADNSAASQMIQEGVSLTSLDACIALCRTNPSYLWAAYDTAGPCYCSATCSYRNIDFASENLYSIGGDTCPSTTTSPTTEETTTEEETTTDAEETTPEETTPEETTPE